MDDQREILETFYQNISYGIFELLVYRDQEIVDEINITIKNIFEAFFTKNLRSDYEIFIKNIFEILKYNIVLLQKDEPEINLLRSVFYALGENNKKLTRKINVNAELLSKLVEINNHFDKLFSLMRKKISKLIITYDKLLDQLRKNSTKISVNDTILKETLKKQNYQVFISHTSLDKPLARRLSSELEKFGIITWLDEKDIMPGQSIPDEITNALENCTHFLLIYSKNSKNKPWVKTELNNILMRRNASENGHPIIIPLLLDNLLPPRLISEVKGIDFSDYGKGIIDLYKVFSIDSKQIISIADFFKLIRHAEKLIETIKWCFQADFFLPIDYEYFWNYVECEDFINNFKIKPSGFDKSYFIFTSTLYHNDCVEPYFDEEFFIYDRSGKIGLYTLKKYMETMYRIDKIIQDNS